MRPVAYHAMQAKDPGTWEVMEKSMEYQGSSKGEVWVKVNIENTLALPNSWSVGVSQSSKSKQFVDSMRGEPVCS